MVAGGARTPSRRRACRPRSERDLLKFISEPIEPVFAKAPDLRKRPPVPDAFVWQGKEYRVAEVVAQWSDRPRLSWGKGRMYFDVKTKDGRVFRLYYDRRPKDAQQRQGFWVLYGELLPGEER